MPCRDPMTNAWRATAGVVPCYAGATEGIHARCDLWRRRHRRLHRLVFEPAADRGRGGRAHRHCLRRLRKIRRLSGAGLVRRHAAGTTCPAQLCPACRARREARRVGLSPARYLGHRRQRKAHAARVGGRTAGLGRAGRPPPAAARRHPHHGADPPRKVHARHDGGGHRRRRAGTDGRGHRPRARCR